MLGTELNMAAGIREFGHATPDAIAIKDGQRHLSFAELDERSNRFASGLVARGILPGERIAILSNNRFEFFEISAGLAKAGIQAVPLNTRNSLADNRYIIQHSEARGIVFDDTLVEAVEPLLSELEVVLSYDGVAGEDYETFLAAAAPVDPMVPVGELEPFCITYTSGTTGKPKGVMLSHRSRVLSAYCAAVEYGLGPGRSTMAVAPMYHGAGFEFAYAAPMLGGTVSVLRKWNPEAFLAMLTEDRIETVFLVPTHAQQVRRIVENPAEVYDLSALKTLYFNAAAMPVALKEWVLKAFPGVDVHELYGSTETSVVTNLRPNFALEKAGSVGHPWFMNQVKLIGDDGEEVGVGEPGELYARSPVLLVGYLKDEEATRAGFDAEGYFTAGDIAVRDADGFISIVDRKKDMIIAGGVNIFPREIEEVIAQVPSVDEVAVIGVPDEVYGERVVAYAAARPGLEIDTAELEAYVRARIAKYKVPREWYVVDTLPRNASGKIVKRQIQQQYVASRVSA
jgi:long-chain acyl-CoA synthetase